MIGNATRESRIAREIRVLSHQLKERNYGWHRVRKVYAMVRPQVMMATHRIRETQPATRASMGGNKRVIPFVHFAINAAFERDGVDGRDNEQNHLGLEEMLL